MLTKAQIAQELQVTTRQVQNLVAKGLIPAPIKLGHRTVRWDEKVWEEWRAKQAPAQPKVRGAGRRARPPRRRSPKRA